MGYGRTRILEYFPQVVPKRVHESNIPKDDEKKARKRAQEQARREARARRQART